MHPPLERTHSPSLLSSLNSDGELTYEELRISCRKTLGISPAVLSDKHIRLLFSALDDDQSGNLDLDEFVDFLIRGPNAVRDKIDASMAKKAAKQHERARKTDSPLLSSPRRTPASPPSSERSRGYPSPSKEDDEAKARSNCIFKFADPANKRELTLPMLANALRMNYFLRAPPGLAPLAARICAKYVTVDKFMKAAEGEDLFTRLRNEFGEFEESKVRTFEKLGRAGLFAVADGAGGIDSPGGGGGDGDGGEMDMKLIARIQAKLKASLYGTDPLTFFKRFDLDGGGTLDYEEFRKLVRGTLKITPRELPDKDVRRVLLALDDDSSGELDIAELADFVRRGVSTDPRDPASLRRSLLLFDSYGEEQVRTFVDMCRSMDGHTTMPVAFSETVLSKSPKLVEFRSQAAAFFSLADPARSGTVSAFMFEQTIHVVINARSKYVNHEEGDLETLKHVMTCGRLVDKMLTFKQEHKIKSLKEVHGIFDVDNTGSLSVENVVLALLTGMNYEALHTMRQHHPQDQPSPLFANWPTSANSERREGFLRECLAELERFAEEHALSLTQLWARIDLKGAGRVSRTELARAIQYEFATHRLTAEFETPIMLAKSPLSPKSPPLDSSGLASLDRKISNTFKFIDKFNLQQISLAQWNESFKTMGALRTGIQTRKKGKQMVKRFRDLLHATGASRDLKQWFAVLAGRKSAGFDTFNLLSLQQPQLVAKIRQMALDAHRLDLTFDDDEAIALTRYIDYRARNTISYANIEEALESLDDNVRGDKEHLFAEHVMVGRRESVAAIALEAEEDVVEIFGMMENHMKATSMRCADLFKQMDYDGEGSITYDEMERCLYALPPLVRAQGVVDPNALAALEAVGETARDGGGGGEEDWFDALITEFDKSKDDVITKVEFQNVWARVTKDLDREYPEGNTGRSPRESVVRLRECIGNVKEWYGTLDTSGGTDTIRSWQLWTFLRKCNAKKGTNFERLDADRIIQYFSPESDGSCGLLDIEEGFQRALNPSSGVIVALCNSRFVRAVNAYLNQNLITTGEVYNSWDIVNFNKCRLTRKQLEVRVKELGLKAGVRWDDTTPWMARGRGSGTGAGIDGDDGTLTGRTKTTNNDRLPEAEEMGDEIAQATEDVFAIADVHDAGVIDEAEFEQAFRKMRQMQSSVLNEEGDQLVVDRFKKLMEAAGMTVDQLFFAFLRKSQAQNDRERFLVVDHFRRSLGRLVAGVRRDDLRFSEHEVDQLLFCIDHRRRGTIQLEDIQSVFDRVGAAQSEHHSFGTFMWLEKVMTDRHMKMRTMFDIIDTDGAGTIDRHKLAHAIHTDFKPSAKWSLDDDEADIEEKYGALLPLVSWLDTNSDGIVEKSDFPGMWRKVTEIASYERPESRELVLDLEVLIFKSGLTVPEVGLRNIFSLSHFCLSPHFLVTNTMVVLRSHRTIKWFGSFASPEGITSHQLHGWFESVALGKFSMKDAYSIIIYIDRRQHAKGTLVGFQSTFKRLHEKPSVVERIAMDNSWILAP